MEAELKHKLDAWLTDRQRARTDLFFLCTEVLQYPDLERDVHGPICEHLQQFNGGRDIVSASTGQIIEYQPFTPLWELKGPRKRLILDPRGHLKTTIITIGHSIQWIINYVDVRILISTAIGDQNTKMMNEIRAHFQYSQAFRFLFEEFCPKPSRAGDFGSQEGFTIPNRKRRAMKEPTVSGVSVGNVIASGHYEVIKHSDLVDKENVKTPNQIRTVKSHYGYTIPLLERGPVEEGDDPEGNPGWIDVEGTRYDFSDLYGTIEENEEKLTKEEKPSQFSMSIRSAYKKDGTPLWPTRFPRKELESIRTDPNVGDYLFSCQYLLKPIPPKGGLASKEEIRFIPREYLRKILLRRHVTIDLAGMETDSTGDFTVLNCSGYDKDGRCYLLELRVGRFSPFEVISHIFDMNKKWRPLDFKIEKDAHGRVILPFLTREMAKRQEFPNIHPMVRDTRTSKKQRILGLQPWFQTSNIIIVEDIDHRIELLQEITRFSQTSTYHDDILDTMADQMQNREGGVQYDIYPNTSPKDFEREFPGQKKFQGFDPITKVPMFTGDIPGEGQNWVDPKTGL